MSNIKFTGILPAFVTPFHEDNKTVNEEAAKKLLDLHLEQGANGFYIVGGIDLNAWHGFGKLLHCALSSTAKILNRC